MSAETIETYIVRIYRRDRDDPQKIAGLVETVGKNEKRSFSRRDQLWEILSLDERTGSEQAASQAKKNR